MILFTLFWQFFIDGDTRRVFSGSPVYCFILIVSTLIGFIMTANACQDDNVLELIRRNDTFILLLPNSIVLLACYFLV